MIYHGKVSGGVVVFDGERPAEGTSVTIEPAPVAVPGGAPGGTTLGERLMQLSGTVEGDFPTDSSLNVDHYLYGLPKR